MTEDELRAAAMDAAWDRARGTDRSLAPPLGPGEFTRVDWQRRRERETGHRPSDSAAKRQLDRMVARGVVASAWRYDPRVGRSVWGYWEVDDTH